MAFSTRLTTPEGQPRLLATVVSAASLLQLAHAVDTLLAHSSVHLCFPVEKGKMLAGAAPITLAPRLTLGGLAAWLPVGMMMPSGDSTIYNVALAAVNEYARVYDILHVLLPPAALSTEDAVTLGFAPDTSDCWRRSARPSSKALD